MRIVFSRDPHGGSIATIHRGDGVVLELPFHSRKHRVPHDLAHAVAEREFGLSDGLYGSIAGGAVFKSMRIVSGRPRYDAAKRSKEILHANKKALTVAEIMAGVLHHAVESPQGFVATAQARHDWGIVRAEPFPWSDEQVNAAVEVLRGLADRWDELGPDEGLDFFWPDRLRSAPAR
jgi:hypothetical protein